MKLRSVYQWTRHAAMSWSLSRNTRAEKPTPRGRDGILCPSTNLSARSLPLGTEPQAASCRGAKGTPRSFSWQNMDLASDQIRHDPIDPDRISRVRGRSGGRLLCGVATSRKALYRVSSPMGKGSLSDLSRGCWRRRDPNSIPVMNAFTAGGRRAPCPLCRKTRTTTPSYEQ